MSVFNALGLESTKFAIAVSVYAVVATFVLLSDADCVVAVTPLVNTPELEVNPPNKVSLVAMSTPSTVPVTVTLPVTVNAPVAAVPDVDKFCDPNEGVTFVPAIPALAFISALTIVPSTRFALATVIADGNAPVASFDKAIAALAFISALTIVPSTMFALATVTSVGKAPAASDPVAIVSVPNLPEGIVPSPKSLASNEAYSSWPVAVAPDPVILFTFKYLSAAIWLSGKINVYDCPALWAGEANLIPWLCAEQFSCNLPSLPPAPRTSTTPVPFGSIFTLPLLVDVVTLLVWTSKSPPSWGEVSSTTLSIALGLAVELAAIPSNFAPSVATSLPSTLPDTAISPVTPIPPDWISNLVEPPSCNFNVLVPASFINEPSVAWWNISRSDPVPTNNFTPSLYLLSPVNVLPVTTAKLPVAVTPPCQAVPL